MKIAFIGSVELSQLLLEKLLALNANIVGVVTKPNSDFNSDFKDLAVLSRANNIPFRYTKDINEEENLDWIKQIGADVIFCFGWSNILKNPILNITPRGVVGFHPANLPQNRGRHPIVWPLILGLGETASTFYLMDESIDGGDIISQKNIRISYKDNARTLYDRIVKTAAKQIEEWLSDFERGSIKLIPQDQSKATYWRKRVKEDGCLDFRMSSRAIYNLVRGLTKPYIGAHVIYNNREIKIWEAKEVAIKMANVECGKVLNVSDDGILIKCYDNGILLTEHEFSYLPNTGDYFL